MLYTTICWLSNMAVLLYSAIFVYFLCQSIKFLSIAMLRIVGSAGGKTIPPVTLLAFFVSYNPPQSTFDS
jgi:hypothetical protein